MDLNFSVPLQGGFALLSVHSVVNGFKASSSPDIRHFDFSSRQRRCGIAHF